MNCPHCRVAFHSELNQVNLGSDIDGYWTADTHICPVCKKMIIKVVLWHQSTGIGTIKRVKYISYAYPKGASRPAAPPEVPKDIAQDYNEACLVLPDSPKASAALSRRCLQHMLRAVAGVKKGDLAEEIQQVLDSGKLPSHLAKSIDAVRQFGNFAAHPLKSQNSGAIIEVEPGEAEWTLDVLEGLFDYYFVQPAIIKKKRQALDAKLQEAGKSPMK